MDHVKSHVARPDAAQNGVEIGAVIIEEPAGGVNGAGDV